MELLTSATFSKPEKKIFSDIISQYLEQDILTDVYPLMFLLTNSYYISPLLKAYNWALSQISSVTGIVTLTSVMHKCILLYF